MLLGFKPKRVFRTRLALLFCYRRQWTKHCI